MMKKTFLSFAAALLTLTVFSAGTAPAQPLQLSAQQIDEKILGFMDESMTVGMSVILVKGNQVVYQNAFGYRDKETGRGACRPAR